MAEFTDKGFVKASLPERPDDANKGTMGTLLCVCGSYGMAGALLMAAKAALRSGVGLVKCALPKSIYPICAQSVWESVYLPLPESESGALGSENLRFLLREAQRADAVLIGCGLGTSAEVKKLVKKLVKNCEKPMVLDADALNCISETPALLKEAAAEVTVTPHPGEMGRLTGKTAAEVNAEREKTAEDFARRTGAVTVLKGAGTVIADRDGRMLINPTGNSGMATGGSGDVLAGMLASLLAQGGKPFETAASAAYLHGLAGDIAAERLGRASMLPTDIIEAIPEAFKRVAE